MLTGCSLNLMMAKMPERVFDVGIAEQHAVTFAAGLAAQGMMPFCNIYSSFGQRAYDQIIHDVALQKLPVIVCLDRGGLVGDDGPTHHGVFDIAALRPVPNLTICAPMDEHELRNMMYTAQLPGKGAVVIRYPRGGSVHVEWQSDFQELKVGKGRVLQEGEKLAVLSIGHIGNNAVTAARRLEAEKGRKIGLYDMRFVKPLDTKLLDEVFFRYRYIITIEDGVLAGGFGSAVLEYYEKAKADAGSVTSGFRDIEFVRMGIPDHFVTHGSVSQLQKDCGIDAASVFQVAKRMLNV